MKKKRRDRQANLMVDESYIEKVCDHAELTKKDRVLEVGAGTGNLTEWLAERAGTVYAIEKNPESYSALKERLEGKSNVELVCADALKIPFPGFDKCVSNMPYEISRKITEKLLRCDFSVAVLVFQKEFVEKLLAEPERENYRYISVLAQTCTDLEILDDVPPQAFCPAPNIWSSIVRIKQRKKADAAYVDFLHTVFNHRNKKLSKTAGAAAGKYSEMRPYELYPEQLEAIFLDGVQKE